MSQTRAERLGVTDGLIWMVGHSDEENALLDPLPDGVETITDRDDALEENINAVVIVIDDYDTIAEYLDDTLPRIGSIPNAWVVTPVTEPGLTVDVVKKTVGEYGWAASDVEALGHNWLAMKLTQA